MNEFSDPNGTSVEQNDASADDNDDSSIPATIEMESYPFKPITANNRLGSESDLQEDPGEVICRLANTTWYVHEL